MTEGLMYHGGVPGLTLGDVLRPPTQTGVKAASDYMPDPREAAHVRRDRVYITSDLHAARFFAAARDGDVYVVLPSSPVEDDPDYLTEPCRSWMCPSAVVVGVVERGVCFHPEAARALQEGWL